MSKPGASWRRSLTPADPRDRGRRGRGVREARARPDGPGDAHGPVRPARGFGRGLQPAAPGRAAGSEGHLHTRRRNPVRPARLRRNRFPQGPRLPDDLRAAGATGAGLLASARTSGRSNWSFGHPPLGSRGYSLEIGNPHGEPRRFILDLGK
ncbi:MAG: hypothetical protein MZV70_07970 [Desulfobacterales bacterium]|nr:hypothetical protein [Desulfobacterales bacterium]